MTTWVCLTWIWFAKLTIKIEKKIYLNQRSKVRLFAALEICKNGYKQCFILHFLTLRLPLLYFKTDRPNETNFQLGNNFITYCHIFCNNSHISWNKISWENKPEVMRYDNISQWRGEQKLMMLIVKSTNPKEIQNRKDLTLSS